MNDIYIWFAEPKPVYGSDGERFIRAWTDNPTKVASLRDAIGKEPTKYAIAPVFNSAEDVDAEIVRLLAYKELRWPEAACSLLEAFKAKADAAGAPTVDAQPDIEHLIDDLLFDERNGHDIDSSRAAIIDAFNAAPSQKPAAEAGARKLAVWYGSLPESNGMTNWTAILHKGDVTEGITIERSEYPDRVRYEADRMRWMIGELDEEPIILDYDADKHSGYAQPSTGPAPLPEATRKAMGATPKLGKVEAGAEPVAWRFQWKKKTDDAWLDNWATQICKPVFGDNDLHYDWRVEPLYLAPPDASAQKGLTPEQIEALSGMSGCDCVGHEECRSYSDCRLNKR